MIKLPGAGALTKRSRILMIAFALELCVKEGPVLDLMRKHARSWFIKAVLAGVIITFILWYGAPDRGGDRERVLAEVNGETISQEAFDTVYRRQVEAIQRRFQGSIPEGALEKMNLKKNVLQQMINEKLLTREAARLGFFVTEDDLVRDIKSSPTLQRDGVFNEQLYRAFLAAQRMTAQLYEVDRKREMTEEQVIRLVIDGIKTDAQEVKEFWHFQNDKLILTYLQISAEPSPEGAELDQKAVTSFYEKNRERYEIPESVNLEQVVFSWKDLAKKINVDDDEARTYHKNNPKEFVIPEKVKLRQIMLGVPLDAGEEVDKATKEKAAALRARIEKGEAFETLAQTESQDKDTADKGGELGLFDAGNMSPEFEAAVKDLNAGEVSQPVRTALGYHLLKLDERKPEGIQSFDEVKPKIVDSLVEKKARAEVDREADAFYEDVYRSEDLDGPAKKFGFEVKKAESVTRAGGIPDMGRSKEALDEAFQIKEGEISKLIRSGDTFAVFKVTTKTPARVPELQEVRSAVEKDFRADEALARARKKAEHIIAELKKNPKEFEETAKKSGLTWTEIEPVARTATMVPQLGNTPEIHEMMVTVSAAAPLFASPVTTPGGIGIVRLSRIEKAGDEAYQKAAPGFKQFYERVRRTEFVQGWLKVLEDQSKITIHDKKL
ncbi:MAG: SurA N-terminal domain-containing protein [Thermodesulfobacteriota bacterium]